MKQKIVCKNYSPAFSAWTGLTQKETVTSGLGKIGPPAQLKYEPNLMVNANPTLRVESSRNRAKIELDSIKKLET